MPTGDDDFLGVQELRNPSGTVLVRDYIDVKEPGRSLTGQSGTGVGVVRVPLVGNRASEPIPAGRWTAKLGRSTIVPNAPKGSTTPLEGRVHGSVLFQISEGGAFRRGALDLDLYVPAGLMVSDGDRGTPHAITAASAPNDPALKTRIDLAFGLFRRLYGIERGDVRYHALPASVATITGQGEIDAANRLANVRSARPAAQVVLTNVLAPDGEDGTAFYVAGKAAAKSGDASERRGARIRLGPITYVIDGQNRGVGKKVSAALVQGFLYDGARVVAELGSTGAEVARFVYATGSHSPERLDYDERGVVTTDSAPGFQAVRRRARSPAPRAPRAPRPAACSAGDAPPRIVPVRGPRCPCPAGPRVS